MNDVERINLSGLESSGATSYLDKIYALDNAFFVLMSGTIGSDCMYYTAACDDIQLAPIISDVGNALGLSGNKTYQVLAGYAGENIKDAKKIELWHFKDNSISKIDITDTVKNNIAPVQIQCDISKGFDSRYGKIDIKGYSESESIGVLRISCDTVSESAGFIARIVDENGKDIFNSNAMYLSENEPGIVFYGKVKTPSKKRILTITDNQSEIILESIELN